MEIVTVEIGTILSENSHNMVKIPLLGNAWCEAQLKFKMQYVFFFREVNSYLLFFSILGLLCMKRRIL